jgi:hypothetical protein
MPGGDLDTRVRSRAFEFLREQTELHGEVLPFATLTKGFQIEGQRVPLLGPQGIFWASQAFPMAWCSARFTTRRSIATSWASRHLGRHPKPAIGRHLKTGHRE